MAISAATTQAARDLEWVRPLASATPFATGLALHALLGPRDHLEPGNRNAIEAGDAHAVHPGRDAIERAIDVLDGLARRRRKREITLALDADRVAFTRFLVELRIALLTLRCELLRGRFELLGLACMAFARLLEQLAEFRQGARGQRRRQPLHRLLLDR